MEKDCMIPPGKCVVVGGSAGSLEVILHAVATLKSDLSFPIVIVVHRKSTTDSMLTDLIASRTKLFVKEAEDKDELMPATIYIAPSDYHLLVEIDKTLSLDFSEKVNFSRPSIDVTFESAADAFGQSVVCILLSGASSDGTEGLQAVKRAGGVTVVQSPESSEVSYMPQQALAAIDVDIIIDANDLGSYLNSLSSK